MIRNGNVAKGRVIEGNINGITGVVREEINKNTLARHTHPNKDVLDGITEEKVTEWDNKSGGGVTPEQVCDIVDKHLEENPVAFAEHSGSSAYADTASTALQAEKAYEADKADYATEASGAHRAGSAVEAQTALYGADGFDLVPQYTRVTSTIDTGTMQYWFVHNTITHLYGEMYSIEFLIDDGIYPEYFSAELTFNTGASTMLIYSMEDIIQWVGTDCTISEDNFSIFAPQAFTHYDVLFYYNGSNITGLVNGYKLASGNA